MNRNLNRGKMMGVHGSVLGKVDGVRKFRRIPRDKRDNIIIRLMTREKNDGNALERGGQNTISADAAQ